MQTGVIADQKISVVKDIEGFHPELQMDSLGHIKHFKKRDVGNPIARAHKSISAKITHAAQARSGEEVYGQIEAIGPLRVCGVDIIGDGVGPVIGLAIEIVVATAVYAIYRIERGWRARPGITGAVPQPGQFVVIGRPVRARLERPDTVELPSSKKQGPSSMEWL